MATLIAPMRFRSEPRRPAFDEPCKVVVLPVDVSEALPSRGLVAVKGQVAGAPVWTVAWPDGQGGHWIKVSAELTGSVDVEIAPSKDWPEPDVPSEVMGALAETPAALDLWNKINAATRTDWLYWLDSAKKAETRVKRIANMCDMLAKGKKKVCCFDRSGIFSKSIVCPVADE